MNSHIEARRLKEAAERKIQLDPPEWKHIEECRTCFDQLQKEVQSERKNRTQSAA
jgi:hypothetical protein